MEGSSGTVQFRRPAAPTSDAPRSATSSSHCRVSFAACQIGSFLGLLGLTVLPISSAVGNFITNIYEDR